MRRHVAQWRRVSARLQVLMNDSGTAQALATEAHPLHRQCERMASDLQALATFARRPSPDRAWRLLHVGRPAQCTAALNTQALPPAPLKAGEPINWNRRTTED